MNTERFTEVLPSGTTITYNVPSRDGIIALIKELHRLGRI